MKKNGLNIYKLTLLLFSFLLLNSCDEVADEIIDCIINKGPVLSTKLLEGGIINEFYSDYVTAEIQNEPNDDDYIYYFSVIGELPDGVEWWVNNRTVTFEGSPTEIGRFDVTVEVFVEASDEWYEDAGTWSDDLCFSSASANYSIRIQKPAY